MSVTLDTNVYVSALQYSSRSSHLLGMAQANILTIDISDQIEQELVRVLREDFGWDGYRLRFLVERLRRLTNRVSPTRTVAVVDDPDDDRIIECALAGGSEYILTNDKALLRVGEYEGIKIMRTADFFALGRER
jgi:putative PIN family toxin of toxin-antitoxin system